MKPSRLTVDDRRRLDALFADRRISPPRPVHDPLTAPCTWCGEPARRYDGHTCSTTTYHADGAPSIQAWHVGCRPPP